jgi:hypothetical protein
MDYSICNRSMLGNYRGLRVWVSGIYCAVTRIKGGSKVAIYVSQPKLGGVVLSDHIWCTVRSGVSGVRKRLKPGDVIEIQGTINLYNTKSHGRVTHKFGMDNCYVEGWRELK